MCSSPGHPLSPVKNPIYQYSSRSIWFERRAIIITAIFLAIFIVLIIGISVFMRDHGPIPEEQDPKKSEEHERIKNMFLSPKNPKMTVRKKLRRRLRRSSQRSTRSTEMTSRSFPKQSASTTLVSEPPFETEEESYDMPPLVVVRVTPRGSILSEDEPQPTQATDTPASTVSHPLNRDVPPLSAPEAPDVPPVTTSSRLDESDVEAVNQLPIEYEAALPPSYVTVSQPTEPGSEKERAPPEQEGVPLGALPASSSLMIPHVLPTLDTHSWAAHVATDDKSTLHALNQEGSAPHAPSSSLPIPSAPPWPSMPDRMEQGGIPGASTCTQAHRSQEGPSEATYDAFPAPPVLFEPSVCDSTVLATTSLHSSKAREAAQESSLLPTLLPSRPSVSGTMAPPPTAPDMTLPLYESDPTSPDIDLELGWGPSAPPQSVDFVNDEPLIPSAPCLEQDSAEGASST